MKEEVFQKNILESIRGILFVMCCLIAGVAIHFGSKKYHYPYTVGCFLFGVLIGLTEVNSMFVQSFTVITRMNPNDMLLAFLPVLIFESSFGMNAHMFFKALPQCLVLAVLGFLFCSFLTAAFVLFALHPYGWSWITCLIFGVIVSATDPVAVVALLKEMKMSHTFTVLIEGESLLNDGIAIVLYEMLTHLVISRKPFEITPTVVDILKTCIGAPTLGYIIGKTTEWILIRIYISPVAEMTITLILAYVTYFVAEKLLGISAILAVVLYGVTLSANKMCISPESENLIHTDWSLLSIYANTLIFMIVGILVAITFSQHFDLLDLWLILATYLALTFLRTLMIVIFYPILRKTGYGLNWKESVILSWGGLRGAIGLALSLMLASDPHLPSSVNANKVLIQVSGIIVLTLIVNANSIKYVMKIIKFKEITLVNRLSMGSAIACVNEINEKSLRTCKREWKFMKADWEWVMRFTKLEDPYKGGLYGDDMDMCSLFVPYGTCNECLTAILPYAPSMDELEELKEATRKKVLNALKGNLWKQFHNGLLQRRSLRLLCVAMDNASDIPNMYLNTEEVQANFMNISRLTHWLETRLSYVTRKKKDGANANLDMEIRHLKKAVFEGFRFWCILIYFSRWFEPFIFAILTVNVIHVALDIYHIEAEYNKFYHVIHHLEEFFVLFYTLETIIKVSALKWNLYLKLNKLEFCVNVVAVLEGILEISISKILKVHNVSTHIRILLVLRMFKYFYVIPNLCITIISAIRNYASSELYYAYDIGRGFLFATEAVLKNIDLITDFGPCAKMPVSVCERNVKEMLNVLDEFEKHYPGVVVALKSNRAARTILNRVKVVLDILKERSLILHEDANEMKSILFTMTKTVVYAPRSRLFIQNIQQVLEEVDWINSQLAKDIYENHVVVSYDSGEVIQETGVMHQCLYIIAKGILKIVGEKYEQETNSQITLPNVDSVLYFQEFKHRSFHDYLTTSQTIGLLGYLQKTPCVTTAICEKDCQLIQIDYSFLEDAERKHDDLIFCMWKSISIKIALQVLKKQRGYQTYAVEDIHLRLQKAILPDLTEATSLEVPLAVEDMVIIQGRIKDMTTQVEFTAPSYIPSTSRHLKLLDDINKRSSVIMLLLLNKKYSLHICSNWIKPEEIMKFVYDVK